MEGCLLDNVTLEEGIKFLTGNLAKFKKHRNFGAILAILGLVFLHTSGNIYHHSVFMYFDFKMLMQG